MEIDANKVPLTISQENVTNYIERAKRTIRQNTIRLQSNSRYDEQDRFDEYQMNGEGQKNQEDYKEDTLDQFSNKNMALRLIDIIRRLKLRNAAQKLINSTRSRMLKRMKPYQYAFINDKCQDFSDLKMGSNQSLLADRYFRIQKRILINKGIQILLKVVKKIPVINPTSRMKSIWDILISILLLYSFFMIPIMVTFGLEESYMVYENWIEILLLFNICNIFIHCNTGFYKKGVLCKDRQTIWRKYYQEQLRIDSWSLLPIVLYRFLSWNIQNQQFYQFMILSILVKWKAVAQLYNNIEQNYILQPNKRNMLNLLNLFFKILLIAHACACIWIFTSRISLYIYNENWIKYKNLTDATWQRQYLSAFYFCTVTMATVGYGDITPQTPIEIVVCIIMVLFACGVFGFSVNTIQGILEDFSKNEKEIMEKMFIIKNYLYKKSINQNLSRDVTEYLEYIWRANQQSNIKQEDKMIKQLPDSLRNELLIESNKIILKECSIFQNNFSDEVINSTISIIQERNYTPDEIIYTESEQVTDSSIYFVQEGTVEIFIEKNYRYNSNSKRNSIAQGNLNQNKFQTIKKLKKGEYFGEIEFFTDGDRQMNVKSVNFSTLLKINRSDFINVLRDYPIDYEQFCFIKDRIYNSDYSRINYNCLSCQSNGHNLKNCPYLHFIANKPKLIAIENRSEFQQRNIIPHEAQLIRQKYQYKMIPKDLFTVSYQFWEMNEDLIEEYESKYLQFSISQCDICMNRKYNYTQHQHVIQPTPIKNPNQKDIQNVSNNTSQNMPCINQHTFCQNCQQILNVQNKALRPLSQQYLQNYSNSINVAANFQTNEDPSNYSKYKKTQIYTQRKQETAEEAMTTESLSPQVGLKLQPIMAQKMKNQSLNIPLANQSPSSQQAYGSQKLIQPIPILDYEEDAASPKINNYHSSLNNHLVQQMSSMNLIYTESLKKIFRNSSLAHFPEFQKDSIDDMNQLHIKQHNQLILFDIFYGQFEQMRIFQFFYPLNNFEFVIKQIRMNSEQRKKMKHKLMQQSRQKLSDMMLKKKKKLRNQSQVDKQNIIFQQQLLEKFEKQENDKRSMKGSMTPGLGQSTSSNINMNAVSCQLKKRRKSDKTTNQQHQQQSNSQIRSQKSQKVTKQSNDKVHDDAQQQSMKDPKSLKIEKSIVVNESKVCSVYEQDQSSTELFNQLCVNTIFPFFNNNSENKITNKQKSNEEKKSVSNNSSLSNLYLEKEFKAIEILNISPPERESKIMKYQHSETPNMNFYIYNSQIEEFQHIE